MEGKRRTAIIAVTADAFEGDEKQIRTKGLDAYVRKPFQANEILEALKKCLKLQYMNGNGLAGRPAPPPESDPLAGKSPALLPPALVQQMRTALEEGDAAHLRELVGQVEETDEGAARRLWTFVDEYDYERLGRWLEQSQAEHE